MTYTKTGPAKYISHLDLMRVYRRAFMRAGIRLIFSQGYNPHPYVSIPLPLPTGFESVCELLDFNAEALPEDFIARMTAALPAGIVPLTVHAREKGTKIDAARYEIRLHGSDFCDVKELFSAPVMAEKRSKRGETTVDLCSYIRSLEVFPEEYGLRLDVLLSAGEQSLNPQYLADAVREKSPGYGWPEFIRREILGADGQRIV